jgi:hypothetical protein
VLKRVHDGELPFDRTVQVSVTDRLEKDQILGRLPHNLRTLEILLKRNRRDYLLALSRKATKNKRIAAWTRLSRASFGGLIGPSSLVSAEQAVVLNEDSYRRSFGDRDPSCGKPKRPISCAKCTHSQIRLCRSKPLLRAGCFTDIDLARVRFRIGRHRDRKGDCAYNHDREDDSRTDAGRGATGNPSACF